MQITEISNKIGFTVITFTRENFHKLQVIYSATHSTGYADFDFSFLRTSMKVKAWKVKVVQRADPKAWRGIGNYHTETVISDATVEAINASRKELEKSASYQTEWMLTIRDVKSVIRRVTSVNLVACIPMYSVDTEASPGYEIGHVNLPDATIHRSDNYHIGGRVMKYMNRGFTTNVILPISTASIDIFIYDRLCEYALWRGCNLKGMKLLCGLHPTHPWNMEATRKCGNVAIQQGNAAKWISSTCYMRSTKPMEMRSSFSLPRRAGKYVTTR
jgi:hypothetical protein